MFANIADSQQLANILNIIYDQIIAATHAVSNTIS